MFTVPIPMALKPITPLENKKQYQTFEILPIAPINERAQRDLSGLKIGGGVSRPPEITTTKIKILRSDLKIEMRKKSYKIGINADKARFRRGDSLIENMKNK
ncbi:hypothetical protein LIER_41927 [Lithospermum erythrorhizon]|uniref:Uncharacterized protein n=1 Tax=Lithospermum erythrorhizon TaxID=34254 RepID=A0AAV3RGH1_LITER